MKKRRRKSSRKLRAKLTYKQKRDERDDLRARGFVCTSFYQRWKGVLNKHDIDKLDHWCESVRLQNYHYDQTWMPEWIFHYLYERCENSLSMKDPVTKLSQDLALAVRLLYKHRDNEELINACRALHAARASHVMTTEILE